MRVLTTALFVLALGAAAAQAQNARKPEFEVASVRQSSPDTIYESFVPTLNVAPGTTVRILNRQLKEYIMIAWGIGGKQLAGPQWLVDSSLQPADIPRFDIVAKVPEGAKREEIPLMMRNLLAERFKLRVHNEQRQLTVYAMELAKGGMKIKPAPEGDRRQPGCSRSMFGANGITTAVCQNMTPTQLAVQLQTLAPGYFREGPVVDQTGLTQAYDFTLEWITQQQRDAGEEGPSMFDATEKLGLHIAKQKANADVLVVDQVEQKPTDN